MPPPSRREFLKTASISAALAVAASLNPVFLAHAEAQAGNETQQTSQAEQENDGWIAYTYPNGTERRFRADVFWIEDVYDAKEDRDIPRVYLTSEAMQAIDVNRQKLQGVHTREEIVEEKDKEKRLAMLTWNNYVYIAHLALQHKDSTNEWVGMELAIDKNKGIELAATIRRLITQLNRSYADVDIETSAELVAFIKRCPRSLHDINLLVRKELGLDEAKEANPQANRGNNTPVPS